MKNKRRTKITIETHEITIIRFNQNQSAIRFCPQCEAVSRFLPVARVAELLQISEMSVFGLLESREVHSTETETGALLICRSSLAALKQT